jgi:HK97 family phage major capsid protein
MKIANRRDFLVASEREWQLVEKGSKNLTESELAELDQLSDAIHKYHAEVADRREAERRPSGQGLSSSVRVLPRNSEQRQHDFHVAVHAMVASSVSGVPMPTIASEFEGGDSVASAMLAGNYSAGGSWVRGEFSEEFIEALRPESVVRQMGAVMIPLEDGTMDFPKENGGVAGRYLGEDEEARAETINTGVVKLIAKEMVLVVPLTDKLLRSRSARAAERVSQIILQSAGVTEDLHFLRGIPAGAGPTGLRFLAAAANVLTMNATVNLANVRSDLGKMELALLNNNVKMRTPGWVMAPRTLVYLQDLQDGNGNLAFPTLSMLGPTGRPMLRNKPVYTTTQIPVNLNGNQSEILLVDADSVLIGDAPTMELKGSDAAAYVNAAGNIKAAFSERKTVMRLVMENDLNVTHNEAIAVLTGVTWGAA